jgi:hypothetical protein
LQFRYRGSRRESAVAQLFSLGVIYFHEFYTNQAGVGVYLEKQEHITRFHTMKQFIAISVAIIAGLTMLVVVCSCGSGARTVAPSVVFVGMTNNPTRQMTPTRIEVCQGATGMCALFWVTNFTANEWVWFKTVSVEQKTASGWQRFSPSSSLWMGIEGSLWGPGYGCLVAVGWPPGLSTNAVWRLELSYGRDTSSSATDINQNTDRSIFKSGSQESTFTSSEVSP